ncbi:TPA: YibE/F family protein [Candidatus Gastranaerophilales bacterium HUM_19]|jgi:yibE/F family protein|nr:yibE/F family protein [Acinetobacter sp. CAG:196]DAB19415.1 MAG TPA: YibE/F family protein [Candidatus Gastranaerophilales bacterium HUM_19]
MKYLLLILSMLFLPVMADEAKILPSQTGIVEKVQYVDLNDDTVSQTKQTIQVRLLTGEFKGETVELDNMLTGNPYYDIKLKKNTKVILHAEDNGEGVEFSIEDIKRSGNLGWLSLLFCGLLIYVGRKKGFYSLISIGLTVLLITHALSPLILIGINPVLATILICVASTAATMYLVGGCNAKSTSAVIGAMLSLLFAGLLSYITMFTAHLTGFTEENSMFLYTAHPELDFIGITISTMILATLGAVMDVAMSIASTINEIYITDNTKTVKDLFISGMNVGRDIIGTMANTLILVYLGGSLPLLLLAGNIDLQKFINLNQVVTETASALIGSIAIVICVPFTAVAASQMIKHFSAKNEDINLDCN